MTEIKQRLFDAFRADHALLGSGFYELATRVRKSDMPGAKVIATKINKEAGAHIVFEERAFYPALERFLDKDELDNMYDEHKRGRALLEKILTIDDSVKLDDSLQKELLTEIHAIESHISECGELFGVMGSLTVEEMRKLLDQLVAYKKQAPSWL